MTEEFKSTIEFLKVNGTAYVPHKTKTQWDIAFRIFNQATGQKKKNNCSSCRGTVYKWFMKHE